MIESKSIALPTWRYPNMIKLKFESNEKHREGQEKTSPGLAVKLIRAADQKNRSNGIQKRKILPSRASLVC